MDNEAEAMTFEEQRLLIDQRRKLLDEDETINDEDRLALKKEFDNAEEELEQQKRASKMQTADTIIGLTNKETAIGKAALLAKQFLIAQEFILNAKSQIANAKKALSDAAVTGAQAGVEVSSSVGKAANAAPPPWNIPFIISAIATGAGIISGVKSAIGATKQAAGAAGAGGSTPSISRPSASTSQPPAFNIVGASGTSQLAEAISEQEKKPQRTYVVADDVSTAQGLDRNIVRGASI